MCLHHNLRLGLKRHPFFKVGFKTKPTLKKDIAKSLTTKLNTKSLIWRQRPKKY
tara:strand:+ start:204 stop:365 length:162 start_codon:yes stop_codon:yes gene_type:complete